MARRCKCKVCKTELMSDQAFCITLTTTNKPKNVYYCNENEYRQEQSDIHFWRQCQYATDDILGYPIVNNHRNKMLTEILNNGYTREELYDCIKEQSNYISECLGYRSDIDSEYGKLAYMFAIIKGSIKDITDRNKKENIKEEKIDLAVETFEYVEQKTTRKERTSSLMDILRG